MPSLYITEPSAKLRKDGGYFVVEVVDTIVQKLSIETVGYYCIALCECVVPCTDGMYDTFDSRKLDI